MSGSKNVLKDLKIRASAQREIIAIQQGNVKKQQKKLSSLERTIRLLSSGESTVQFSIPERGSSSDDEDEDSYDEDSDDDTENGTLQDPIWDHLDDVFRCSECSWEVIDGFCHACASEFRWDLAEIRKLQPAVSTHSDALSSDRSRLPRGNTPLIDINPSVSAPVSLYYRRAEEFRALLQRGATRLMCETFNLEFSEKDGIFAWADEDIYEQFSGPAMLKGDFWKIHLGRRIELDEDDLDGSMFIEGLLEDVLLYPPRWCTVNKRRKEVWETVEETPGIWVTRLMTSRIIADSDGESETSDAEGFEELPSELWAPGDMYEQALDATPAPVTGPVITSDEYELSGEEVDEGSDVEMMDDSGWAWKAGVPDAVWASESDEDEVIELDDNGARVSSQLGSVDDGTDSDDVDSDFDSDEVLSGDDVVMRRSIL